MSEPHAPRGQTWRREQSAKAWTTVAGSWTSRAHAPSNGTPFTVVYHTARNLDVKTCGVVGLPMNRSEGTGAGLVVLATLCKVEALNGGALFVVVPGFDHHKWQGMGGVKIAIVEVQRVLESFPAAVRHVTIQSPFCSRIVEARPGSTDGNLVGMLVAHVLVEIVQILFAPITSVGRP